MSAHSLTTDLPITSITADPRAQSRAEIDSALVAEYAELMRDGVKFPPLTVFYDGDIYWLAEGFHRLEAYRQAGIEACPCVVKQGGLRDAILLSVGSNSAHGKRPTIADKRHAVELLLKDSEWSDWSDREIGKKCCVDHKTVGSIRSSYLGKSPDTPSNPTPETVRKAVRNNKEYSIKIGGIGKARLYESLSAKDKARFNRYGKAKPKQPEPVKPEPVETETPVNEELDNLTNSTTQAEPVKPESNEPVTPVVHDEPVKPTIEQLQAEIEKLSRSRDYWKKKVKDDDRRILYERNEERWKENRVKAEFGTDAFSEILREQNKRQAELAAKMYGLQIPMPLSVWRRLVQLTHPDKHGGSDAAIEATQWLLKNRPEETL